MESLRVEAHHFAATGHVPQPVPLDQRRAADALERPVVGTAGRQLFAGVLPQERPIRFLETEQAPEIHRRGIPFQVPGAVVGAHPDAAAGYHRVPVGLASQSSNPFDIPRSVRNPLPRLPVEIADLPLGRDISRVRRVIALGRTAPLGPVSGRRRQGAGQNDSREAGGGQAFHGQYSSGGSTWRTATCGRLERLNYTSAAPPAPRRPGGGGLQSLTSSARPQFLRNS